MHKEGVMENTGTTATTAVTGTTSTTDVTGTAANVNAAQPNDHYAEVIAQMKAENERERAFRVQQKPKSIRR